MESDLWSFTLGLAYFMFHQGKMISLIWDIGYFSKEYCLSTGWSQINSRVEEPLQKSLKTSSQVPNCIRVT